MWKQKYKQHLSKCSVDELLSQYNDVSSTVECCTDMLNDIDVCDREMWQEQYDEALEYKKLIECELSYRRINI